ncbi:MAG: zinc-finger domain-containing protein [Proteobacteria bacterium]|nr:zinc-finger domain-containing protein [Pseudomonadota bacterium]
MQNHSYEEVILASSKRVACDGGVAGHPRVWLTLDSDSQQVVCPYCSRLYAGEGAAIWHSDSTTPPSSQASQDETDG